MYVCLYQQTKSFSLHEYYMQGGEVVVVVLVLCVCGGGGGGGISKAKGQ